MALRISFATPVDTMFGAARKRTRIVASSGQSPRAVLAVGRSPPIETLYNAAAARWRWRAPPGNEIRPAEFSTVARLAVVDARRGLDLEALRRVEGERFGLLKLFEGL